MRDLDLSLVQANEAYNILKAILVEQPDLLVEQDCNVYRLGTNSKMKGVVAFTMWRKREESGQ